MTGGGGGGPFLKESNVSRSPHKRHIFVFFVLLLPGHNILNYFYQIKIGYLCLPVFFTQCSKLNLSFMFINHYNQSVKIKKLKTRTRFVSD